MNLVLKLNPSLLQKSLSPPTPPKPKKEKFRELNQRAYLQSLYTHATRDLTPQQWLTPDGQVTSTRRSLDPSKNREHVHVSSDPADPYATPCLWSRSLAAQVRTNTAILQFMCSVCSSIEAPAGWDWRDIINPPPTQLEFDFTRSAK